MKGRRRQFNRGSIARGIKRGAPAAAILAAVVQAQRLYGYLWIPAGTTINVSAGTTLDDTDEYGSGVSFDGSGSDSYLNLASDANNPAQLLVHRDVYMTMTSGSAAIA